MTKPCSPPTGWSEIELGNICVPGGLVRGPFGGSLKKSDFVQSGFQVYEQRHAIYGAKTRARYFIDSRKFAEMARFAVEPGDFIISCSGTIGRIARIPRSAPKGVINQALLKIRVNEDVIDPCFFLAQFRWDAFQERILDSTQGGAMQNLVGMPIFRATRLSLPPRSEQREIAEALSDTDDLIAALERLIAKKQAIKQGMMQQLLTGKSRLPGFTASWRKLQLGDHVSYVKTVALSRAQLDTESPVRYLHYGDIHTRTNIRLDAAHEPMPRASSTLLQNAGQLQIGDLVFADASEDADGVGRSIEITSVPAAGVVAGLHTIAARFDKAVLADGFKAYLQFIPSFRTSLLRLAAGTKVLATTRSFISSITLRLPDVDEQREIAAVLRDADEEIQLLQLRLAKARYLKQGMMQELLTGRTRLPIKEIAA